MLRPSLTRPTLIARRPHPLFLSDLMKPFLAVTTPPDHREVVVQSPSSLSSQRNAHSLESVVGQLLDGAFACYR